MATEKQLVALESYAKFREAQKAEDVDAVNAIRAKHPDFIEELGVTDRHVSKAEKLHAKEKRAACEAEDADALCVINIAIAKDALLLAGFSEADLANAGII